MMDDSPSNRGLPVQSEMAKSVRHHPVFSALGSNFDGREDRASSWNKSMFQTSIGPFRAYTIILKNGVRSLPSRSA